LELEPDEGAVWHTLAVAQYRTGDWKTAIVSLEKSMKRMPESYASHVTFFLAMAHWQLGNKDEAHKWYGQAVASMQKYAPDDEELLAFRAEAGALLEIGEAQPAQK
jgi:Tfp pilus assembly protein PilF